MRCDRCVLVLGGGLSGVGAAYTLAREGWRDVTVVERRPELGGLAGSFEQDGCFYPLGYHHILHRDRTLLYFLHQIDVLPKVRWRRIRIYFRVNEELYDFGHPVDFLRFPMGFADKLRFARLMLKAFNKADWMDWVGRSGSDLVDSWAGPGVRQAIFDPLTHLKYELGSEHISAAWLGARLHFREGSAPLGYVPHANWTKLLCDGLTRMLEESGVRILTNAKVTRMRVDRGRISQVEIEGGERLRPDVVVSTLPTEIYLRLAPDDETPEIRSVSYTALLSTICVTRQCVHPDFYWMNLASPDTTARGLFQLNSLNRTIGGPDETCLNFVNHLRSSLRPLFATDDDKLVAAYKEDFARIFGDDLEPEWVKISRIPMYSPVFFSGYRNPPIRSSSLENVFFAGNYRTFPSIASTGTALASGIEAGEAILADCGRKSDLRSAVSRFRLQSLPKGRSDA